MTCINAVDRKKAAVLSCAGITERLGINMVRTVKFGGTSLADAQMMKRCADIIHSDASRRYIVVSAPGKRNPEDVKVTDLLYRLYAEKYSGREYVDTLYQIRDRFEEMICDLGIAFDLSAEMEEIRTGLEHLPGSDWLASRGEYLNAKIFAAYLGVPFVDAAVLIRMKADHTMDEEETYRNAAEVLKHYEYAVIPGFYGADENGRIITFTRGGSDVTGSVIARAVKADLYENWTDVSGVLSADPRIVKNPKRVSMLSYRELRELSYMGASVLHEDAVFPLKNTGIPIEIRNTMDPEAEGTRIAAVYPFDRDKHLVTGIAGKKGFSNLQIEMAMMNSQVGFGAKVLEIFADHGISYEHTPTSIDIMSVIAETVYMESCRNELIQEINEAFHPDRIFIEDGLALVAVVGEGISANVGVAARVLQSIADAGISVKMIDAGCSELNIIIGVTEADYEKTIRSLYDSLEEYMH